MPLRAPVFLALVALTLAAVPFAYARLGDTDDALRKRFGRPEAQPAKNILVWLIEEPAGALLYTVTFDDRGRSIAEGLKPYRNAALTEQSARNFIADQISVLAEPSTARLVKPGESYTFGGETLSCGPDEHIIVDDAHDLLVIWTKDRNASVMAATHEMMRRTRR
jgi:hypothetical protein